MANIVELLKNKFDLFRKFTRRRSRSELNGFNKCIVFNELLVQLVSCFDFEHVVAQSYDVRHGLHLKLLRHLQEGFYFPLVVLPRILFFEFGPSGNYLDVSSF